MPLFQGLFYCTFGEAFSWKMNDKMFVRIIIIINYSVIEGLLKSN